MTKLVVTRNSEWNNRAREFGIYVDDVKIGVINNGEMKEFDIEPGLHKINGKIDWCNSQKMEFTVNENESKKIELSGYKYSKETSRISLGMLLIYFLTKYAFNIELGFLIIIIAIGFLYPLYYITFGKNHYLRIREINTKYNN